MVERIVYQAIIVDNTMFNSVGYVECAVVDYHNLYDLKNNFAFNYLENVDFSKDSAFMTRIMKLKREGSLIKCYPLSIYGGYDTGVYITPNLYSWCYVVPITNNFSSGDAVIVGYVNFGYTDYDKSGDSNIKSFPIPFKFPSQFAQREEETILVDDKNDEFTVEEKKKANNVLYYIDFEKEKNKTTINNGILIKQKFNNLFYKDSNLIPTENLISINKDKILIEKRKILSSYNDDDENKYFSDEGILLNDEKYENIDNLEEKDYNIKLSDYPDVKKQFFNRYEINDYGFVFEAITNKKDKDVINEYDIVKKKYTKENDITKTVIKLNEEKLNIEIDNPVSFEEDNENAFDVENKRRKSEYEISDKGFKYLVNQNYDDKKNYILFENLIDYTKTDKNEIDETFQPKLNFEMGFDNKKFNINSLIDDENTVSKFDINFVKTENNKEIKQNITLDNENEIIDIETNNANDETNAKITLDNKNYSININTINKDGKSENLIIDSKNEIITLQDKNNKNSLTINTKDSKFEVKLNDKLVFSLDKENKLILEVKEITLTTDTLKIKDAGDSVPLLSKLESLFSDTIVKHTHTCSHGKTATSMEVQKLSSLNSIKSKVIKTD